MTPHEALYALRAPDQRNMGRAATHDTGEATAERVADLEGTARTIRSWNPHIIPGPLQAPAYAADAIKTAFPALSPGEVQRRVATRTRRADAFLDRWREGSDVGYAWFVLGESAVCDPFTEGLALCSQLEHLLGLLDSHGKLVIQVLADHVATAGRAGQFSLYEAMGGPRVGYLETLVGGWYTTRSEDVARMHTAFSDIMNAAFTPWDSRELIKEQVKWWNDNRNIEVFRSDGQATATQGTASPSQRRTR